jgi:hypothetical protein
MDDVTTLDGRIRSDHRIVLELLGEIEAAWAIGSAHWGDSEVAASRPVHPSTLIRLVQAHVTAAEVVVGVATERLPDGPVFAQQAMREHETIREHLAVLQRVPHDSVEYAGALDGLAVEVRQHMQPEEDVVGRLMTALDQKERETLHHEFELARAGVLLGDAVVSLDPVSERAVESARTRTDDERSPA